MARRATSLGPKPSLFLFFVFWGFFVLFFLLVFFGGFKGQVTWPEGPPHLALNPPYLFLFSFLFCFLVFNTKNLVVPPAKGIFCLFSVFLFLSPLAFFGLPLFLFLFLCLSLFFFSFFLSSFLSFRFAFFWFLVFVSSFPFPSSLLFFHARNNIKILNCKFCIHQYFLFFWFPVFFLFQVPFSYLCDFLILSYVFCSTSRFLISKQTT